MKKIHPAASILCYLLGALLFLFCLLYTSSMASLISYKQVAREYPAQRQKYFLWFTVCNVALLALLLVTDLVL